jgi:hypothetical protein
VDYCWIVVSLMVWLMVTCVRSATGGIAADGSQGGSSRSTRCDGPESRV